MHGESIDQGPCRDRRVVLNLLPLGKDFMQGLRFPEELVEERKLRPGDDVEARSELILIVSGLGVCRSILLSRFVLHLKAIVEELSYPRVLRDGG